MWSARMLAFLRSGNWTFTASAAALAIPSWTSGFPLEIGETQI